MSIFFPEDVPPAVTHSIARVERRLPVPGEVLVRVGSRVEPDDVIARAIVPRETTIINVARDLGVRPEQVYATMRKEEGNKVAPNEVIARTSALGRRVCTTPIGGTISMIDRTTGYVVIEPDPQQIELRAQVRGLVMHVDQRGVTIETPASLIHGIAGCGEDRFGVLRVLVADPRDIAERIDATSSYAIVVTGAAVTPELLQQAREHEVRGIIAGGINVDVLEEFLGPDAYKLMQLGRGSWDLPAGQAGEGGLTLMLTEGFGRRTISAPIFELLTTYAQQECLIQGRTSLRAPLIRPRLVIPLTRSRSSDSTELPHPPVVVGAMVRLLDEAHLGLVGTVAGLPYDDQPLPSGVRGPVALVQLGDGERVVVARSAVEALAQEGR